jgi:purine-binding chemotaxis protein CheW
LHEVLPQTRSASTAARIQKSVVFELDGQAYAIAVEAVEEILPMARLSRPPQAPALLAGFLNLEGKPVPVIRLRRLLGLPDRPADLYTPLMLLRVAGRHIVFIVDAIRQIVSFRASDIAPVESTCSLNECATGIVDVDGHVAVMLSPERLLLEQERAVIDALTETEQTRLRTLAETLP